MILKHKKKVKNNMGQRLVIQIEENGQPLANAYYHWSAYTGSAAELTNNVLEYLEKCDKDFTPRQKAAWALYCTGARFNQQETKDLENSSIDRKQFEFVFDDVSADRNRGLLCVTENGMKENVYHEEGMVNIDIGDNTIYFGVMCVESIDEYRTWHSDSESIKFDKLPVVNFNWDLEFKTDDWPEFYEKIMELYHAGDWVAISEDKTLLFEMIG